MTSTDSKNTSPLEAIFESRVFGALELFSQPTTDAQPASQIVSEGINGSYLIRLSEGIPQEILAATLGIEVNCLPKLYNQHLSKLYTGRINGLTLLWIGIRAVFRENNDSALEWFRSPIPALSGNSPLEIVNTTDGQRAIQKALDAMLSGDFT